MTEDLRKRAWIVTIAALGANLGIGVLYSWSIIARFLQEDLGWSSTEAQIPYMIACGVFALMMVPGGRAQDKLGPRIVITIGGMFVGLGFILSYFWLTLTGLAICFGVIVGTGIGAVYCSTTPSAVKWFGPEKRGLISGIVVSGFGGAPIFAAPLSEFLILNVGLEMTLLILGAIFLAAIVFFAQLVKVPPQGYIPPAPASESQGKMKENENGKTVKTDFDWHEVLRHPRFYLLWIMFCFSALAGLMMIGHLSTIAVEQTGASLGFYLVGTLAVFNALGRIGAGHTQDKWGRVNTMYLIFGLQAVNFLLFDFYTTIPLMLLGTVVAGYCYGALLSVFPSTTAHLFGVKNLGINYGLLFTSWGIGGVAGGYLGGMVRDITGTYSGAYLTAAALLVVCVVFTYFTRKPVEPIYKDSEESEEYAPSQSVRKGAV